MDVFLYYFLPFILYYIFLINQFMHSSILYLFQKNLYKV